MSLLRRTSFVIYPQLQNSMDRAARFSHRDSTDAMGVAKLFLAKAWVAGVSPSRPSTSAMTIASTRKCEFYRRLCHEAGIEAGNPYLSRKHTISHT